MLQKSTWQQGPGQRPVTGVTVCVTGIIVRCHGGGRLAPVAVQVEAPTSGVDTGGVIPLSRQGLGAALEHFQGERLMVMGRLVEVGNLRCLRVKSYGMSGDRYRERMSTRAGCNPSI